mmetsp:Transcript_16783/g.37044  ORF Transcript_16783/g.37044 Transcript_16783/m.37044 type:complete len:240 (-) Transcript_16783:39-758(-)
MSNYLSAAALAAKQGTLQGQMQHKYETQKKRVELCLQTKKEFELGLLEAQRIYADDDAFREWMASETYRQRKSQEQQKGRQWTLRAERAQKNREEVMRQRENKGRSEITNKSQRLEAFLAERTKGAVDMPRKHTTEVLQMSIAERDRTRELVATKEKAFFREMMQRERNGGIASSPPIRPKTVGVLARARSTPTMAKKTLAVPSPKAELEPGTPSTVEGSMCASALSESSLAPAPVDAQ